MWIKTSLVQRFASSFSRSEPVCSVCQTDFTLFCVQVQPSLSRWVICWLHADHLIQVFAVWVWLSQLYYFCSWANRYYTIFHFLSQTVLWYVWVQGRQDTSCFCFNSSRLVAYLGTTQTKYISQKGLLTAKFSLLSLPAWHSGGKLGHPATEHGMTFLFFVKSPFTQHGATHWLIWEHPLVLLYLNHSKLPSPISQKINVHVNIGFSIKRTGHSYG